MCKQEGTSKRFKTWQASGLPRQLNLPVKRVVKCTSSLVKNTYCLWDMSKYIAGECPQIVSTTYAHHLAAKRPAIVSPTRFEERMRADVASGELAFTAGKTDMELVINKYKEGFVNTLNEAEGFVDWFGLEWTDADAVLIAEALAYAEKHCTRTCKATFRVGDNNFTQQGESALYDAVSNST
eukprot:5389078-Prymnesium_polylepis.1